MYGQQQRINTIYQPYSNLINRSPINISPNRAPIPHYNNPIYYSNPYQNLINPRR